jgi:hypothetical protein
MPSDVARGPNAAAIAAVVVGGLAIVTLAVLIASWYRRSRHPSVPPLVEHSETVVLAEHELTVHQIYI